MCCMYVTDFKSDKNKLWIRKQVSMYISDLNSAIEKRKNRCVIYY